MFIVYSKRSCVTVPERVASIHPEINYLNVILNTNGTRVPVTHAVLHVFPIKNPEALLNTLRLLGPTGPFSSANDNFSFLVTDLHNANVVTDK